KLCHSERSEEPCATQHEETDFHGDALYSAHHPLYGGRATAGEAGNDRGQFRDPGAGGGVARVRRARVVQCKRPRRPSERLRRLGLCTDSAVGEGRRMYFDKYYYQAGRRYARGEDRYVLKGDPLRAAEAARGETAPITLAEYGGTPLTCAALSPLALLPKPQ